MIPTVTPLARSLLISWTDFQEPEDHEFYQVFLGTTSPPGQMYSELKVKQITIPDLEPGTTYYIQVFAFDCFGPGQGSGIVSGVPLEDTGQDGTESNHQTGTTGLTTSPVDIVTTRFTTTDGEVVYFWTCLNFASIVGAANATLQVVRRVPGGGGNPPPTVLRASYGAVPTGGFPQTIHVNGQEAPPAGDWEYVLQAYASLTGLTGANGYMDFLIKR